jgi:hypothetical protein
MKERTDWHIHYHPDSLARDQVAITDKLKLAKVKAGAFLSRVEVGTSRQVAEFKNHLVKEGILADERMQIIRINAF